MINRTLPSQIFKSFVVAPAKIVSPHPTRRAIVTRAPNNSPYLYMYVEMDMSSTHCAVSLCSIIYTQGVWDHRRTPLQERSQTDDLT